MLRAELLKKAKHMYPHYTYLYKKPKAELEAIVNGQYCPSQNTFKDWENNSCYIDSLLFVLARMPSIEWQVQSTLSASHQKIAKLIRSKILNDIENADVSKLRKLLQKFKNDIDWLHEQQEPMDLWRSLEEMFVMFKTHYGTDVFDSAIQEVILESDKKNKLVLDKITAANLLVFHINRRTSYFDSGKRMDHIDGPLRFRPKENMTPLYLRAVIVHHGKSGDSGHYTTFFDCKGIWWEFDDMKGHIRRIGLILPEYVHKNSSDYFYW